jgi:hypothetical protein
VIFSRRRGNAGRHNAGRSSPAPSLEEQSPPVRPSALRDEPEFGPYDSSEAPDDTSERLDLGALQIPALAGVEIQLQAGPQGEVQQIQLAHAGSRLQLGVFAAPRSEGIWTEVREGVRTSLASSGARVVESDGDYGRELQARIRDGSATVEVRHVGIDGPRWFLHAVFIGPAAVDPELDGPLRDVLRGLVVNRGTEAKPVGEALALQLPPETAAQLNESVAQQPPDRRTT